MDHGKDKIRTKKIKVYGIVQGVGFRPLVYRIANSMNIKGSVKNIGGYVEIVAQAEEEKLQAFSEQLKEKQNGSCEIIRLDEEELSCGEYQDFIIIKSDRSSEISIIPPDLPVCADCSKELYNHTDRRFHNPFISCMSCGPRYTIIEELPYDRKNTTMRDFTMCGKCQEEYRSPESRRFHAQTISCDDCGPYLIYQSLSDEEVGLSLQASEKTYFPKKRAGEDNLEELSQVKLSQEELNKEKFKQKELSQGMVSQEELNQEKFNQEELNQEKFKQEELSLGKLRQEELSQGKLSQEKLSYGEISQKELSRGVFCREVDNQEAFYKAVNAIQQGKIIAVKGIGGYHFVCSPFVEEAVLRLRKLKGREEKPFAVMFPSLEEIRRFCIVSKEEATLLTSAARPIVLLYRQEDSMAPSVNKNSIYCGAFLPYTPLQILLTAQCGPLVMTSANISDRPVIREDEQLFALNSPELSGILYNMRRIVRSVDDSVAKIIDGKPQLIRRSRGYVPYPVFLDQDGISVERGKQDKTIFAAGGDLKAAFCLYRDGNAVVSQYFGDLIEVSVMEEYKRAYEDLTGLLTINPTTAVCDLHPNYKSSRFTKELGIPVLQVQHHHAHIASVMAEHELKGKVIGVAFDGTGYGTDGNIWGGEFMICEEADFLRTAHLKYTKILGGDQSMKDAKKTAACYLFDSELSEYIMDERKEIICTALEHGINTLLTSSMGRLFDAVAAILSLGQENRYEGECAMLLEKEAVLALKDKVEPEKLTFAIYEKNEIIEIDPKPLLKSICAWTKASDNRALALGFHIAIAEMITEVCERLKVRYETNTVALSGGVFQNTVLTEQTLLLLRQKDFDVFVNLAVPPNDGAISLGQTYIALKSKD